MDAIGKEFERNPPDTFVVSLAADTTQETMTLNLIPFIESSIGRSARKVLVSLQQFSWWSSQDVPHWVVCDIDAAALLTGLCEVDQVKSFTNFEAAGLKFALLSFVYFDLGRSQGLRVEAALRESRDGAVRSMHVQRRG